MRRLPTTVRVYGYPGGVETMQSETWMSYDWGGEYAPQAAAGISGHDVNYVNFFPGTEMEVVRNRYRTDNPTERGVSYLTRGASNQVSARVNMSETWINTHARHDIAGNLVLSRDGKNHPTTLTYQSGNHAFLSTVTSAVGSVNHTVSMQYDANTGKMTQHTDPSGVVTALAYEGDLGRLNQVIHGAGSSFAKTSSISYNDTANTATVTSQVAAPPDVPSAITATSITKYDGLGRVRETEQATGGSPIISRTNYDALGRVKQQSLPSDNGVYQYTSFAYDALGRMYRSTNADSSVVRSCYKGDLVIARDEAGKWKQSKYDALGRLIQVIEDPSSVACDTQSSSGSGLGYVTNYAYNAVDNLLTVSHMVGGSAGQTRSFTYDMAGRLLSANNPETGVINYTGYDGNGNLTGKTDARGVATTYTYDALNRPLGKSYTGVSTPAVTWVWDTAKVGRLTSVESGISKTSFTYDTVARVATSTQRTDSVDYAFEYRYHKGWGLRQMRYPSQRWVRYTPDVADRIAKIERLTGAEVVDRTYWNGVQYAPQGAVKQVTLGNGLIERWQYNPQRQQPWQIKVGDAQNEASRMQLAFNYCGGFNETSCNANNGNIVGQWNYTPNRIQNYTYDALNRLASASEGGTGGWSETYGYDRYSNLYWAARTGLGTANLMQPQGTSWFTNNRNRAVPPPTENESTYYDAAGNLKKYGSLNVSFDGENRPVQVTGSGTVTYHYDGEGRRVKKVDGSVTTRYVYDAMGNLAAEYGGAAQPVATHYVTTDHLGSTRLVTDGSGTVVSRHDYLPFGEEIAAGIGGRTTGLMYVANPGLTHRFTGKERDTETGLDYFGARYMSAPMGRFTGADAPFADQFASNPQSWNLYSYVGNSPLLYTDPSGRGKLSVFFKVATRVLPDGRIFKKVTDKQISRDEARRLFRKEKEDVYGSRKSAKNTAGRNSIEDPVHGRGAGDNKPHFHDQDRSGPHAMYDTSKVIVPGASVGVDTFGDNIVGEAVDFFNPLADAQTAVDLVEAGIEIVNESLADFFTERMRQGASIPCFGCTPPPVPTPEDAGKGSGRTRQSVERCPTGEDNCASPR